VSCGDPQKHCMRRLPATLDATFEFAATCGGAALKFKMPEPAVGYFRDGVQGPNWQQLSALTSIRAANLAYAATLWMGTGTHYGWIISGGTPEQTFTSSYSYDARWDYCNGTASVEAEIRLMYR
jgi:hypothetical protein